jgi:hypothetical protein
MAEKRPNVPVIVGGVPLFTVTSFVLNEGYQTAQIAGGSGFIQLSKPTAKTINIEALLIKEFRSYRPLLEALALTTRGLTTVTAILGKLTGIPVVTKNGVHLDMQITKLVFSQDNQMRDTLKVTIELTQVLRPITILAGISAGADLALGAASGFI